MPDRPQGLGDMVANALSKVGITEERLSGWLGRPCGCRTRRIKLNNLSAWARRVLGGQPQAESISDLANMAQDPTLVQPEPPNDTKQAVKQLVSTSKGKPLPITVKVVRRAARYLKTGPNNL